jgi:hypothetical protein
MQRPYTRGRALTFDQLFRILLPSDGALFEARVTANLTGRTP